MRKEHSLPTYQINLPAQVRFDPNLSAHAKLLYGEIKALCDQQGYCWAGNNHLAFLYNVQAKVASRWINQLAEQGYIKVEVCHGNQRKIFINSDLPEKGAPPPSSVDGGNSKVEAGLLNNRSDGQLHLINNFIDYNDRIHSVSTLDSSTLKWREQGEKKPEERRSITGEVKRQTSTSPPVAASPPPRKKEPTQKFVKPSVSEVEEYMKSQSELCPDSLTARGQALRFVNYYEANGWKVGRNDMQDWQAAANNWLLNAKDYANQASKLSRNDISSPNFDPYASRLHTGGRQDYSIPL
ncbi:hypothetical protein OKW21_004347 [Catalinimonas alkaloidigena]|uniref:helix-turn-helix domain-containing protein n=1 Tax=Catalinimonas TaxID=1522128 RepID=UPI002405238F|nr:helix-turn-helix domain-containing protein [Catalinimonas alkaloidigena]MDF9799084.1 hypothetical protein [Catalinimonas alkaloidigena]